MDLMQTLAKSFGEVEKVLRLFAEAKKLKVKEILIEWLKWRW